MSRLDADALVIRTVSEDEWDDMCAVDETAFLGVMSQDERDGARSVHEFERTLGAYDDGQLVGTASAYTFDLSAPGGQVPVAGVTWVSVLPTHRRRGILTSLMRTQLHGLHEEGREAVAALWASEPAIYGRFGYGAASRQLALTLPRDPKALAHASEASTDSALTARLLPAAGSAALTNEVYERVARQRPGIPRRREPWLQRAEADMPSRRRSRSALRCVVVERDGQVQAYARYATEPKDEPEGFRGVVHVREVMGADPLAYAAVWRYLLDLDLTVTVRAGNQPIDDPLLELLADPRRARPIVTDGLFVRLVEVDRALAARAYQSPVELVLEVADPLCPWNAGRWRLTGDPSGGSCERTAAAADLSLGVLELGAAYLGGISLRRLAAAGRVEEHRAGALHAASLAFGHDPAPWCPFIF
jgi:predicted acetyltransferase